MKRQDAIYVAVCLGTIAFCIGFLLPYFVAQRVAWYLPLARDWDFTIKPKVLGMDFYGRFAQGMIAWAVTMIASLQITRRVKSDLSPRIAALLVAWALGLVVLCMMYFVWTLAFRIPAPSPIPDWYIPR